MAVPYPIINDTPPWTQAIAGLNQFIYSTTWTADDSSDILVYSRGPYVLTNDLTQLVPSNQYTVQFIGDQNLVQVTFNSPYNPPQYNIVTIMRNTPSDRMNLYTNTNFTPSMLNSDFGTLVQVDQQNQLYWQQIIPRYNNSATVNVPIDTILPILGANEFWAKNVSNTSFIAINIDDIVGSAAPADAPFVTYTDDADLTNPFNLGLLTSGILGINVVSGTATPFSVSFLANSVLINDGSLVPSFSTTLPSGLTIPLPIINQINDSLGNPIVSFQSVSSPTGSVSITQGASAGYPIISAVNTSSNGSIGISSQGTFPVIFLTMGSGYTFYTGSSYTHRSDFSFPTSASTTRVYTFPDATGTIALTSNLPTPAALTESNDTNVTLTLGGTPNTALLQAVSLTLGWTGLLSPTRGGTGVNNGSNLLTLAGNLTTSGNFNSTFTMTAATNVTFPTSGTLATTANLPTLPLSLANGGTNSNNTASNGGIVYSSATGLNILAGTATANQVLVSGSNTTPSWSTTPYLTQVKDVNGNVVCQFVSVASSVNNFYIHSNAATGKVSYGALGTDTDINLSANTKGAGFFEFVSQATTTPFVIFSGTLSQHQSNFAFSNTSANRTITFPDVTGTVTMLGNTSLGSGTNIVLGTTYTSWTPTFIFGTVGDLSVSYSTQVGGVIRNGNIITLSFNIVCTPTFTTASGSAFIGAVPTISNSTTGNTVIGNVYLGSITTFPTGRTSVSCAISPGQNTISLVASGPALGITTFQTTNFTSGTAITIVGTITYFV